MWLSPAVEQFVVQVRWTCSRPGCQPILKTGVRDAQGVPPRDVLRTVYVEHDIDASEAGTPVVDFVHGDKSLQGPPRCAPRAALLLRRACHAQKVPGTSVRDR